MSWISYGWCLAVVGPVEDWFVLANLAQDNSFGPASYTYCTLATIVGADQAPELAMYYSGSTAIYIKPIAGSSLAPPPKGGKGKANDET